MVYELITWFPIVFHGKEKWHYNSVEHAFVEISFQRVEYVAFT